MTALLSAKGRHRRGYRPPRPRPARSCGSWTGWALLSRLFPADDFSRPRATPLGIFPMEAPFAGYRHPYDSQNGHAA
ncbi:hypothetical protein ABZW49_10750 [Nonomuraea wenchangensis]